MKKEDELAEELEMEKIMAQEYVDSMNLKDKENPSMELPGWNVKIKKEFHVEEFTDRCCFCQAVFEEDEDMLRLPCDHFFHQACIKMIFASELGRKCSICSRVYPDGQVGDPAFDFHADV